MIVVPGPDGRMLFTACRSLVAWRGRGRSWVMVKPPWNRPLFSEREGKVKTVLKWRGWRLLKDPRTFDTRPL